jgi:hypothetical protein
MEKIKFELMSKEEFYAVEYKDKEYTLQHNHDMNSDYQYNEIYFDGKRIDEKTEEEILEAFSELK